VDLAKEEQIVIDKSPALRKNNLLKMGMPRVELGKYPRQGYSLPLAYTPL
jgi:hypothetical protein